MKKPLVTITCAYCGKDFKTEEISIKYGRKFCSKECSYASKKHKKVKKICKYCGEEFEVHKSRDDYYNVSYCSRECLRNDKTSKLICKRCGKEYIVEKHLENISHFCSRYCKDTWRKENIRGENHWQYNRVHINCVVCGKDMYVTPSRLKNYNVKFCSRVCASLSKNGEKSGFWKGGVSYGDYCHKFNKLFKRRVRKFFNNTCVLCGKNKMENKNKDMSVHHVDNKKDTCCVDSKRLFVTICMSCHNKTRTNMYKEEYEQYFEDLINLRYGGKCYYTEDEYREIKKNKT